jgi:hypothetical protein
MNIKPTEIYLSSIRTKYHDTKGRSAKKKVIDDAAKQFNYSRSHMSRILQLRTRKRSLSKEELEEMNIHEEYTRKVYEFKFKADYDQTTFTVKQAFECLVNNKQIPVEINLKTIYNTARRIGLINEYKSPARKFTGRTAPLHLVMVDYSKSVYFHFKKNGSITMENPVFSKRNQPRLMIAAAIDQYSRVRWYKYYAVEGESSEFVRDVLLEVFSEKNVFDIHTGEIITPRRILQGIPRELYFDRGSGNLSGETESGLTKLGVKKIVGSVEIDNRGRRTNRSNKKARGMIEKAIGDFKRNFEGMLWGRKLLGDLPIDITLAKLNQWVETYCELVNASTHPVLSSDVRWTLFEPALSAVSFPSAEAKMFFGGWLPRKVRRRLIMGRTKQEWFVAPNSINDKQTVDVVFESNDCYIFLHNELVKLKPQSSSVRDMREKETGTECYSEQLLKERLAEELLFQSNGMVTLRSLPQSLCDDVTEFSEKPRSVTEIKEKATYFLFTIRNSNGGNIIPFRS